VLVGNSSTIQPRNGTWYHPTKMYSDLQYHLKFCTASTPTRRERTTTEFSATVGVSVAERYDTRESECAKGAPSRRRQCGFAAQLTVRLFAHETRGG
jgi:hypothetical protein